VADPRTEISASVRALLEQEARRNEHRVGIVRILGMALVFSLDVSLFASGLRPASNMLLSALLVGQSVAVVWLVRSRYRTWHRFLIPALDAVAFGYLVNDRIEHHGLTPGMAAVATLTASLLATTGGMRFDKKAAMWANVLAIAVFTALVGWRDHSPQIFYSYGVLLAIALLNVSLSDVVRRSMEGIRGRALLRRFLRDDLVERAFTDPFGLLPEPKQASATVMITDLRDFTALAEAAPPVEVFELLNDLQGHLAAAVQAHQGVVDKFMGDGMLAVFGAPQSDPDHAKHAIAASRAILVAVHELNQRRTGREPLRIGVGIHSGEVVAGCLGGGDRLEFTVVGDAVNTAARLEGLTKQFGVQVLVSEATAAKAGLELTPLGETLVRGRTQTVRLFTLPEQRAAAA
jgi:adenylate cyclase